MMAAPDMLMPNFGRIAIDVPIFKNADSPFINHLSPINLDNSYIISCNNTINIPDS